MLHNATLIHDDIVDETSLRRGEPTINASMETISRCLWVTFFVSNALAAGIRTGNIDVVSALSALGCELSLGEIDQICNVRDHHYDEESYISMIRQKTASLFMTCVRMGAQVAGASAREVEPVVRFAELLGLCFQIKDDIFDYYPNPQIGKPTGNDLREGKVTLPLIHALAVAPAEESLRMKALIESGDLNQDNIQTLIDFAKCYGGIDYSFERMRSMQREAYAVIDSCPDSESKRDFKEIFEFIISRDK